MILLHVFEENDDIGRRDHLDFWLGYPDLGPHSEENDPDMVCYCGGRLVMLRQSFNNDTVKDVGVVWHRMQYSSKFILGEDQ